MTITDIFDEARDLVDASTKSYPDTKLLRRVNTAYGDIVSQIIGADGTWQFDDTNYTNVPIGTATLVEGQSGYTFEDDFLDILTVKVMDANGHWHILDPIDQSERRQPLEEMLITPGFPRKYDKVGNEIRIFPTALANVVTLSGGLKVEFQRPPQLFTTDDINTGTIEPGFAINHVVLAYKAALPYALSYKKDRVGMLNAEIVRMSAEIIDHYAKREKDKRKRLRTKRIRFR